MKPYENCKVLGPYLRKDGRSHVCIKVDGKWKTVSYPKYLMEIHIGRYFTKQETVDHKDDDFTNNDFSNLQILERVKHIKLDGKRRVLPIIECQVCKIMFQVTHRMIGNSSKTKSGPFCSKKCAGYATHFPDKFKKVLIDKEYYTLKTTPLW